MSERAPRQMSAAERAATWRISFALVVAFALGASAACFALGPWKPCRVASYSQPSVSIPSPIPTDPPTNILDQLKAMEASTTGTSIVPTQFTAAQNVSPDGSTASTGGMVTTPSQQPGVYRDVFPWAVPGTTQRGVFMGPRIDVRSAPVSPNSIDDHLNILTVTPLPPVSSSIGQVWIGDDLPASHSGWWTLPVSPSSGQPVFECDTAGHGAGVNCKIAPTLTYLPVDTCPAAKFGPCSGGSACSCTATCAADGKTWPARSGNVCYSEDEPK